MAETGCFLDQARLGQSHAMPAAQKAAHGKGAQATAWCHELTLFKNPFKTCEALTERKRGIRMGFSRMTARMGGEGPAPGGLPGQL